MVFEIAAGVCIGIVLAVLVLRHWKKFLVGSFALLFWGAILGALLIGASFIWQHISTALIYGGAIVCVLVLYGIPFALYNAALRRYPSLSPLVKGDPPWDSAARLPIRLLVMMAIALAVAGIGVGGLFGGVYLAEVVMEAV